MNNLGAQIHLNFILTWHTNLVNVEEESGVISAYLCNISKWRSAFNVLHLLGFSAYGIVCCKRGKEAVTRTNLNYTYQLGTVASFRLHT